MSIAIVDVRGWQNTLDLASGEKTEAAGPIAGMMRDVLKTHPYPGDTDPGSNRWVSDTALDLIGRYNPRFVFLTYASQYFSTRYTPMPPEARTALIADAFEEAKRFMDASGFASIVVGTGSMTPLLGSVDVTKLDGLALCTHWSIRYAGLYEPSREDMKTLAENPLIERIVPREEIIALFNGTPDQAERVPEYLMLTREGYTFRTVRDLMRTPVMIPAFNFHIPLHAPGHGVEDITGIRRVVEESLSEKKTALIVMEGAGTGDFPWPHEACRNGVGWYYYEPGEAQYMTISSGGHRFLDYPTGRKSTSRKPDEERLYPFSGYFNAIPEGTIGRTFPGKSIAVGNKSMVIHMVAGADVTVECFARNLYNHGTMGVIHREDK